MDPWEKDGLSEEDMLAINQQTGEMADFLTRLVSKGDVFAQFEYASVCLHGDAYFPFQFSEEKDILIRGNEEFAEMVLQDLLIKGMKYPIGLGDNMHVMGGCNTLLGELYMRKTEAAIKNNPRDIYKSQMYKAQAKKYFEDGLRYGSVVAVEALIEKFDRVDLKDRYKPQLSN